MTGKLLKDFPRNIAGTSTVASNVEPPWRATIPARKLATRRLARHNPPMVFSPHTWLGFITSACLILPLPTFAEPLAAPGDMLLRHDLQLLNDAGAINIPMTAWPVALGDVARALRSTDVSELSGAENAAYRRVHDYVAFELETGAWTPGTRFALAENPRVIRSFEDTPREQAEANGSLAWVGERFAFKLAATLVNDPFDGEEIRPDGTYIGVALGNWSVTAGWQDRWWGPSRDGSLILGTNARSTPGIAVQRIVSTPFETKWLSWLGPWTLSSFMSILDDDRTINDTLLFGIRGSFRPPGTGLEIGISRTAQWCGDGRPCDASAFWNLLIGNDNRGVNVDLEDEPGNQLGGIDIRWRLPKGIPAAAYMQWIGEDSRGGGGAIGSWMRQVGLEHWGSVAGLSHRTHFEVSDATCREGGFGFSDEKPDCAYEHSIYFTGYRYRGRSIGHPADGDTLSYSLGSTLVQSGGPVWNVLLRHMEINRVGNANLRHTLAPTPQEQMDLQVSHRRMTRYGYWHAGAGFVRNEDQATGTTRSEAFGFIQWSSN
jgi:hypothetical protein